MQQEEDVVFRTPNSSSSSAPSGTQALSVTIEPERAEELPLPDAAAPPPAQIAADEDALAVGAEALYVEPPLPEQDGPFAGDFAVGTQAEEPSYEAPQAEFVETPAAPVELSAPETDAAFADVPMNEFAVAEAAEFAPIDAALDEIVPEEVVQQVDVAELAEAHVEPSEPAQDAMFVNGNAHTFAATDTTTESAETAPIQFAPVEAAAIEIAASPAAPENDTAAHQRKTEELRQAVRESLVDHAGKRERTLAMVEEMSQTLGSMLDEARHDAALIGRKMMEFVQANFESNVELARDYAGARSVPEIVNVHTAYVKRQVELLNRQAEEFRALTGDIASKRVGKLQGQGKA